MPFAYEELDKFADWEPPSESEVRAAIGGGADLGFQWSDDCYRTYVSFWIYSISEFESARRQSQAYARRNVWQVYLSREAPLAVMGRSGCLLWSPEVVNELEASDVVDVAGLEVDEARPLIAAVTGFGYQFLSPADVREIVPESIASARQGYLKQPLVTFDVVFFEEPD